MINPIHSQNKDSKVNPSLAPAPANSTEAPPKTKNSAFDNAIDQTLAQNQSPKPNNGNISQTQPKGSQEKAIPTPPPPPVKPQSTGNENNGMNLNKLI